MTFSDAQASEPAQGQLSLEWTPLSRMAVRENHAQPASRVKSHVGKNGTVATTSWPPKSFSAMSWPTPPSEKPESSVVPAR